MKTARRRKRVFDPLATPSGVRGVLARLANQAPDLIPKSEKELVSMLNAVRHVERSPATDTRRGRPSPWDRSRLLSVASRLRSVLDRETDGRVSLSSFVSQYLRVLSFPADLTSALERCEINLQEATILARLTATKLKVSEEEAAAIRGQMLRSHVQSHGSQNQLCARVKEALGESGTVSSETLAIGVLKADALLEVSPEDLRHLFFETMKELFYAIRSFEADDLTEADIDEFMASADILSGTIHAIERRASKRRQPKQTLVGFALQPEPEKKAKAVKDPLTGRITYSFG